MLSVRLQDASVFPGWRVFHKPFAIELQAANIFIAYPYMNMRRLEVVFSSVYEKAKRSFFCDGWHDPPLTNQYYVS